MCSPLTEILRALRFYDSPELIVFTEFLGPESFAGRHRPDDDMQLVLLDVMSAAGMISPEQFVTDFGSLDALARVVYRGKFTGQFAADVREGRYDVAEGVVCKGGRTGDVWMAKIKTRAYLDRLKASFGRKWEEYWE